MVLVCVLCFITVLAVSRFWRKLSNILRTSSWVWLPCWISDTGVFWGRISVLFQRRLLMLEALKQISGLLIRLNDYVEYGDYVEYSDYVGYGGQGNGNKREKNPPTSCGSETWGTCGSAEPGTLSCPTIDAGEHSDLHGTGAVEVLHSTAGFTNCGFCLSASLAAWSAFTANGAFFDCQETSGILEDMFVEQWVPK